MTELIPVAAGNRIADLVSAAIPRDAAFLTDLTELPESRPLSVRGGLLAVIGTWTATCGQGGDSPPEIWASRCVRSGSFLCESSVGPECTRPDLASRPLVRKPEVGGALAYVWGQRGVRYE